MFSNAIVREPSRSMVKGITTAKLGLPNYEQALEQHRVYCQALKDCGVEVLILPPEEEYPDSCFIEDTAIVNKESAIITRPGTKAREGEIYSVAKTLESIFTNVSYIEKPGTVDGGDILKIENTYYIGISKRTNKNGAEQLSKILTELGFETTFVEVSKYLHLKTGVNYLGEGVVIVAGEFIDHPIFKEFKQVLVSTEEESAANSLEVNGHILTPKGFSKTKKLLQDLGKPIIEIPLTEYQKLDGGLSCLSLRY